MVSALDRIASGVRPVIDTEYTLETYEEGLGRMEHRDVFGKILVSL
jgi:alcohol dehydrogenase